jgi:MerR family mercuric resistance operon transcriptional regulator
MVMTVGKLARRTSLSTDTIRYYEKVGLLHEPARTTSGYRTYDQSAVERLRFIKDGQRLGLQLREISELLEIWDQGQCPCGHTRALLENRLTDIQGEITALKRMEIEVKRMMASEKNGRFQWCCPTVGNKDQAGQAAARAERRETEDDQSYG